MRTMSWPKGLILVAGLVGASLALQGCATAAPSETAAPEVNYPNGPINYVIPYGPGGGSDLVGREFTRLLGAELGATFVVENLPGGDETIGVSSLLEAAPDGQTIGLSSPAGIIIGPLVAPDLAYSGRDDYTPLVTMTRSPVVLFVSKDSPYKTIAAFIKAAKASPGALTIGTIGRTTPLTLDIVSLEKEADIDLNIVPFSGGAAEVTTAALGGQIDAFVAAANAQIGLVQSGDLLPLAHNSDESYNDVMPGSVPFESLGYDIPFSIDFLNIAPKGVDAAVREKLVDAAFAVASSDGWAKWCTSNGLLAIPMKGEELEDWIKTTSEKVENAIDLVNDSGL